MTIRLDEKRGHFYMDVPWNNERGTVGEVTACDLGPVLHLLTNGAHLTPDDYRELARALTWWADRPRRDEPEQLAEEINDLFSLLGEEGR